MNKQWVKARKIGNNSDLSYPENLRGKSEKFYNRLQYLSGVDELNEIKTNHLLSEAGQVEAIEKLTAAQRAAQESFIEDLRLEVLRSAAQIDSLKGINALLEKNHKNYDFARLEYEARGVASSIELADGDYNQITLALEMALASLDDHKAKVWKDISPGLLPRETRPDKHGIEQPYNSDVKLAFLDKLREAEVISMNDEQKRYHKESETLKDDLAFYHRLAERVDEINTKKGSRSTGYAKKIFNGVSLASHVMIEDKETNESPAEYMKRKQSEIETSRAPYDEMAKKLGTSIDWNRQEEPA